MIGSMGGSAMLKSTSEADLGGSTGDPPAAARSATADAIAARLAAGMSSSSPDPRVFSSSSEKGLVTTKSPLMMTPVIEGLAGAAPRAT